MGIFDHEGIWNAWKSKISPGAGADQMNEIAKGIILADIIKTVIGIGIALLAMAIYAAWLWWDDRKDK